jgi:hypothetical protein
VERAAVSAPANLRLGLARLAKGALAHDGGDGAEPGAD